MLSLSKVRGIVFESVYFRPLSLMYYGFVVVFLVVPDPSNPSNTLNAPNFRDTRPQLTVFPFCTPPETRCLPEAVKRNCSQSILWLLWGLQWESETCRNGQDRDVGTAPQGNLKPRVQSPKAPTRPFRCPTLSPATHSSGWLDSSFGAVGSLREAPPQVSGCFAHTQRPTPGLHEARCG